MSTENKDSILVYKNGNKEFKIEVGKVYQVVPKFDADAIDGFRAHNTTKILDPDAGVTAVPIAYFDTDRKLYDTALSVNSKALRKLYPSDSERTTAFKKIKKLIVDPLTQEKGESNLDPTNFEYWDEQRVALNVDDSFNTSNPYSLYQLYSLILHGKLAPTELASEPYFKQSSQYCIENKDEVISSTQKIELNKTKAVGKFSFLLDEDKKGLEALLDWMGIQGLENADESLLNIVFTDWLRRDENQNPVKFLDNYENLYKSKSGREKITVYKALKELESMDKITRTGSGELIFDDEVIGKDFKEAAERVIKDQDLLKKIYSVKEL